jgi:hypothetical protein
MRISMRSRGFGLAILVAGVVALICASSAAATQAPAWSAIAAAYPTNLPPGDSGVIGVYAQNVGGISSSGTITVEDKLPTGLVTKESASGAGWSCEQTGADQTELTCTSSAVVAPGLTPEPILIPVKVVTGTPGTVINDVTVSSPGALGGHFKQSVTISPTPAKPGFQSFVAAAYGEDGGLTTQAASHPYVGASMVFVNTVRGGGSNDKVVPAGDPKTIRADLPPGFLGNPTAVERCTEGLLDKECPISSQVGTAQVVTETPQHLHSPAPVHAIEAPLGYPAKFTFEVAGLFQVNVVGSVRSDEDYGLTVESPNTAEVEPVLGAIFNFWGSPGSPTHSAQRCVVIVPPSGCGLSTSGNIAFLTQSSDCALQAEEALAGTGPFVITAVDTWLTPGEFQEGKYPVPPVSGCDNPELQESFEETKFTLQPEQKSAATPSAFTAELELPQEGLTDPEKLATPPLKTSVVTLPKGVVVNPSSADGLATCSEKQIGFREFGPAPNHIRFNKASPQCPDASQIGTVEVETALLDNPLPGTLYLAAQDDNPFGSTLAVYLVIDDPTVGVIVKLPGKVVPDPVSGQMTAVFDDGPQLAFGNLTLTFKGGERAPLATPDTCGLATTVGQFTPWSAPESGPDTFTSDSFDVTGGPNGGSCAATKAARPFQPGFTAGTSSSTAGGYAPFSFKVTRKDGEQELKGIEFTLPPGLTGKLAGIATCSDGAIAAAGNATGKGEQANSSCPSGSQLGTVTSTAGIGGNPISVGGKLYLAGPYKGAPLSAVAIIPAVAGPYDLGNVVSRTALYVDPVTAQLTAKTDPIPDILDGIPLALRSVKVSVDRPGFILNPTSCEKMAIATKLTGAGGDTVSSADDNLVSKTTPFQVGGCDALAFKPKLTATLKGGTKRSDHPAFTSVLTYPQGGGYANTAFASVALPHSEFLDQAHIRTVCTRVQFAADACPRGAIYGQAEAITPLLDEPLSGPVYLRSSSNKLPDLVVALKGPASRPIEVDLAGRVDSVHGGIRTTFETAPDAPVSKFILRMQGGKKGLLVNSRNLCKGKPGRMTVRLLAHNNKRADQFPKLGNSCGKKHKRAR